MEPTRLTFHTKFRIGEVDRASSAASWSTWAAAPTRESAIRQSKHADEDGFRTDVMDALRRLDMTAASSR